MYRYWHRHWQPDLCRHRVHSAYEHSGKGQWQRVAGSLLCGVMAWGGQRVPPPNSADNGATRSLSKSDVDTSEKKDATLLASRTACSPVTEADDAASCGAANSGFARGNTPPPPPSHEATTNTRCSTKNESSAPGRGATATNNEQPSPPPSRPSQSLYTTALRETPLFVKHEAIQTSTSKTKTRSAFAVIKTDGESNGQSPGTDGDNKSKQPSAAAKDKDAGTDHHHHCYYHHRGVCWAAYHHCRQMCGHAWSWPPPFHTQQESKDEKKGSDTTCAGFFINVSKDEWGVLLKEAWNQIKSMIQRSEGTILLDHVPSAPTVGDNAAHANGHADVTIGESVRWYDAHCGHQTGHQRTEYCSCAFSAPQEGCLHAHKCCQHQKADDVNSFYQPHRYFQGSPNQFYDCFECQVSSSHQY